MDFDVNQIKASFNLANSAMQAAAISEEIARNQRLMDEVNMQNAKRNATLVAGAEANIAQKELMEQQFDVLQKQNELLSDNYTKLKEMFDAQVEANKEAQIELKRSKRFNIGMMIISVVAMLAAIAGPIVTILVSK